LQIYRTFGDGTFWKGAATGHQVQKGQKTDPNGVSGSKVKASIIFINNF
jgi:hypothetical protein